MVKNKRHHILYVHQVFKKKERQWKGSEPTNSPPPPITWVQTKLHPTMTEEILETILLIIFSTKDRKKKTLTWVKKRVYCLLLIHTKGHFPLTLSSWSVRPEPQVTGTHRKVNATYFYSVIYLEISKFIVIYRGKDRSDLDLLRIEGGGFTEIINK